MLGAGLSYWLSSVTTVGLGLAVLCLAVNWFGDSLDGTLARVRQHQRPRYGYYIDHVLDAFGALCLFGGLALSGHMSPVIALGLLVAYLIMAVEVYLAAHVLGEFRITYFNLGPTELRILLAIGSLWLPVRPTVTLLGDTWRLFDVGGLVAIAGLAVVVVATCSRHTRTLYRAEPIPDGRVFSGAASSGGRA
jgi:phosphatidylglycerophosphate synthase